MFLVQSMDGGFVTRNCKECGRFETLSEQHFKQLNIWVACPDCGRRMVAAVLPDRNYGYICQHCDLGIPLYKLLPRYTDF